VVAAIRDPNPETDGAGFARLRAAGVEVELAGGELEWRARVQNEAYRVWVVERRPFVVYKAAVTLDGRVTVPGSRWVTGEESRRRVHELRARMDAVGVGMGTVRADNPDLTAREVGAERQPRRLAFGSGPLPHGSELELRTGQLEEELGRLAQECVQSLLLEGGPTLATAFLDAGLVDKLMLFVAPTLAGAGPRWLGELPEPIALLRPSVERVGDDVLVTAYVRSP
jgi:diaminohydroxyphosphoribosylaminopyrimidine deaminase / 5-amino-6-(5-phosphoribosylamino)uracil reductase